MLGYVSASVLASMVPVAAQAATVVNPICTNNTALFDPGNGQDIVVPPGFRVSRFTTATLNFPTGIAFRRAGPGFEVYVLKSGHGLPSQCNNENSAIVGGTFSPTNPFTPDILVFDQNGNKIRGPLAKPTNTGGGLQPHGPAVDIAFENELNGGRLFATNSNQSLRTAGNNNSSRIVTVDPMTGQVTPFIKGLPTGDHPSEQLAFNGNFIYWTQGSTTNSGVVGRDNGGGANQPDIPCQDIVLSQNVFDWVAGRLRAATRLSARNAKAPLCLLSKTQQPAACAMVQSCERGSTAPIRPLPSSRFHGATATAMPFASRLTITR